jgi:hypothetical protein
MTSQPSLVFGYDTAESGAAKERPAMLQTSLLFGRFLRPRRRLRMLALRMRERFGK